MLMRYTGQGIGHKNTHSRTAAFREDVTAAYGSWVAEMDSDSEMLDYAEDGVGDDDGSEEEEEEEDDESEVNEDEDDSDWEDDLSEEGEEEQGFDENDDVLAEEDEYGYAPL